MNTSDMSYYDFDKVDLEIARRVEKEGIKALLDDDSDYGPNASFTYYRYMNVNDTARVWYYADNNSASSYSNADYMKFAGHLVG